MFQLIYCRLSRFTLFLLLISATTTAFASNTIVPAPEDNPHYSTVGFFDIHVCNWTGRPLFFLTLFSSYQYNDIAKVEAFTPNRHLIGQLNLERYRVVQDKGKPEKRVFITNFDIPKDGGDGWYYAIITMKDGSRYKAKDFVIQHKMQQATNATPKDGSENIPLPKKLTWDPIPGAKYYKVFLIDNWEEATIYKSDLLTKPELILPKGILSPGGYYSWRIHARDVNENVLLGDFNHGSLTKPMTFTVSNNSDSAK